MNYVHVQECMKATFSNQKQVNHIISKWILLYTHTLEWISQPNEHFLKKQQTNMFKCNLRYYTNQSN